MKKILLLGLLLAIGFFPKNEIQAQCSPDVTPPVAVCDASLNVNLGSSGSVTLFATEVDDGSLDNCTAQVDLSFTIEAVFPPSPTPPTAISVTLTQLGIHNLSLWVTDQAGNWNQCWVAVEVLANDCTNDTEAPTPLCENGIIVELLPGSTEMQILATDLNDHSFDNCSLSANLEFRLENTASPSANPPATTSLDLAEGIHDLVMWVGDEAGNWDYCQTTLEVTPCIGTTILVCNDVVEVSLIPGLGSDFFPEDILEGGPYCASGGGYFAMQFEPPSTPVPVIELTPADVGEHVVSVGLYEAGGTLISECWSTVNVSAMSLTKGRVFADTTANCVYDDEPNLGGQPVQGLGMVTGTVYETTTDANGFYSLQTDVADNVVEISLPLGFNYGGTCPTTYTSTFPVGSTGIQVFDIPVQLNAKCDLLSVDIGASALRRCLANTYSVNYCNLSTGAIDDVSVEVTLDNFMDVTGTSIPGTQLDDLTWSFDIGTLAPGECGQFDIDFILECAASFGQTHCVEAHIFPDTICPQGGTFSGANIEVDGYCENDSIYLSITNTGTAAMALPLDYIVVEDVIMFDGGTFDLGPGQTMPLDPFYASGSTYRLEAEQETNHPYGGVAAIAIEGCGGNFTPGFVNFFPMNTPNPFISTDCQENIGSYDPNDKQAFPRGYGEEHFIEKNTDIEYRIRFQNTGTDTAFNVVVLDTLSPNLDAASIRPGASSHTYQYELLDGNVVRFTFANIMLPDSNVNEALSHGFVKFLAPQMPDLENGTLIENSAAIFFDFNQPVITNTVFHTIGEHFIEVINRTDERPDGLGELHVFPNPSFGNVSFELPADAPDGAVFQVHDHLGRRAVMEQFTGGKYRFERGTLAPGVYFYSIDVEGLGRYAGKIILK